VLGVIEGSTIKINTAKTRPATRFGITPGGCGFGIWGSSVISIVTGTRDVFPTAPSIGCQARVQQIMPPRHDSGLTRTTADDQQIQKETVPPSIETQCTSPKYDR
jgi:hypothetical protein